MSVEHNKDGSVTIKSNNGSTAVISPMIEMKDDRRSTIFKSWLEECAERITPCAHTFKETEQYFLDKYDALQLNPGDRRIKTFKMNVIMNHGKDLLIQQPEEFSFDMTDDEMENWKSNDDLFRMEVMNSSPESYGLTIRGYYLPVNEHNAVLYEQAQKQYLKLLQIEGNRRGTPDSDVQNKISQIQHQDICVFFEDRTEYFHTDGGSLLLLNDLTAFRGVTMEDINQRNLRFLGYVFALKDLGICGGIYGA